MPHKVNPIDFENAEGNFGLANALLGISADKLPISRWQRDLTDSTVLRNVGVALGHTLIALAIAAARSRASSTPDAQRLAADLDGATGKCWREAVQTVMRRHGVPNAYEQLKELHARPAPSTASCWPVSSRRCRLPEAERTRLARLTPRDYVGYAPLLAAQWRPLAALACNPVRISLHPCRCVPDEA